jgi:predicted metallo-beta-lactamase superfamily hydrolase
MKIESVIRRTIIIINGEARIINESDLTELVLDHHLLNDDVFTNEEDVINFLGK